MDSLQVISSKINIGNFWALLLLLLWLLLLLLSLLLLLLVVVLFIKFVLVFYGYIRLL